MTRCHVEFLKRPSAAPYMEVDDESIGFTAEGRGSFAQLFKAEGHTSSDGRIRKLAIKAFLRDPDESGVYQDVEKEYHILARLLGSSHSAQLYGMGYLTWGESENEDQMLCLVESYAPGIRMDKALATSWFSHGHAGDPTPKESLGACVALAEAVSDVATYGVVNRDLGPDNVFFSREGGRLKVTLIDFGNGQESGGGVTPTTRAHLAKWQYGAPEVYPGCEYYYERTLASTDVYSLGALCYQLLSGRVPFPGITSLGGGNAGSYSAALDARRGGDGKGRPALPEACVDSLGPVGSRVSDIVASCMSYNPGDRPSARNVYQTLMRCVDDLAATPVMPKTKVASAITPDVQPKPSRNVQPMPIPKAQTAPKVQPQTQAKVKVHAAPMRPPAEKSAQTGAPAKAVSNQKRVAQPTTAGSSSGTRQASARVPRPPVGPAEYVNGDLYINGAPTEKVFSVGRNYTHAPSYYDLYDLKGVQSSQSPKASPSERHGVAAENNRQAGRTSDRQKQKARKTRATVIENIEEILGWLVLGLLGTVLILVLEGLFLPDARFLYAALLSAMVVVGVYWAGWGVLNVTDTPCWLGEQSKKRQKAKGYIEIVVASIFIVIGIMVLLNYGSIIAFIDSHFVF